MKTFFPLKAFLTVFLSVLSLRALALQPYKYNWKQIKTDHFTVIFDSSHLNFGKLISQKAEQAFTSLESFSKQHPKNTIIIIDHTQNISNGSATFFPYPTIVLQPTPPSPNASIGQYDDWLFELLLHEYTHILSFHNIRGFYTPLRWILGSSVSPGYFLPTWYLEGLAVFTESHLTSGGRLRTARYQSYKNQLNRPNISIANEQNTGIYPNGSGPYIFGGWLLEESFSSPKTDPVIISKKLHKKFTKRLPYFINSAFKSATKGSAYKHWKKAFKKSKLKNNSLKNSFQGRFAQWSDAHNSLFYLRKNAHLLDELVEVKNKKHSVLFKIRDLRSFKITKKNIFFLSPDLENQDFQSFNLRSYNFKSKKIKKITSGLNARNFDILKNKILAVSTSLSGDSLVLFNFNSIERKKILYTSNTQERIALPKFKTQNTVIFSFKKPNKKEKIIELNINSLNLKTIATQKNINHIEIYNGEISYLYEKNRQRFIKDLTLNFQVSPEILSFSKKSQIKAFLTKITPKGTYIFEEPLKSVKRVQKETQLIPIPSPPIQINTTKDQDLKSYSSFYKLRPHYIIPNYVFSPYGFSGESLYGASIGGNDPLNFNKYSLGFFQDSITKKLSSNFSYSSQHFRLPIHFNAGLTYDPISLTVFRSIKQASLSSNYTFNSNYGKSFNLGFGALFDETKIEGSSNLLKRTGLISSLTYNSSRVFPRELSPEKGFLARLRAQYYLPAGDDYFDYFKLSLDFKKYFKSPLIKTHRIIFGIDGLWNDKSLPFALTNSSKNQLYRTAPLGTFLMRGLPSGSLATTDWFATAHLEYRFPILNVNWGPGLLPGFFNRVTGAFTSDYGLLKGVSFLKNNPIAIDQNSKLYSAGAEIIIEGKAFYHAPVNLQIGVYKFLNSKLFDLDPEVFIGFNISGLP